MFTSKLHSLSLFATVALTLSDIGSPLHGQESASPRLKADPERIKASPETALDRYVKAPDPAYTWRLIRQDKTDQGTVSIIEMISQQWKTDKEVDFPLWKHWLTVVTPAKVRHETGLLIIGGGSRRADPPSKADSNAIRMAQAAGTVVVELKDVPNQPLVSTGDGKPRKEDDIIAFTWDKFLQTGDESWPLRLPMTKAAVRAMDTIAAFCAGEEGGKHKVDTFAVAGGSKRGWTTWSTAAVDSRVVAIAPIVIDVLNIGASLANHWRNYGFWAPAVGPYAAIPLDKWVGTPEFDKLLTIEDPYRYRARLTLPKLVLNASGDQFFPCDSSHAYYSELKGPKLIRYVPNADHSLRGTDAWSTLISWYQSVLTGATMPKFTWKSDREGELKVNDAGEPLLVRLWQATNPKARDFRVESVGKIWKSTDLKPNSGGTYEITVPKPAEGWTAFFIELTYGHPSGLPLVLSTEVEVTPRKQPFEFPAKK